MGDYCELCITADESMREILVAELAGMGYDGFEESEGLLKAYIPDGHFNQVDLDILFNKYVIKYSKSIIHKQNWNALWESNFEPVQVDDFVGVRAAFHPAFTNVKHEIVITPKMSFGTGHHATTYMVMKLMEELDFTSKSVYDFGTGTGILAILAEKLGAKRVVAVDNDDWCIENASENILINHCNLVDIHKVDEMDNDCQYDIILANINRNIILDNVDALKQSVASDGQLLLSGLLKADESDIINACHALGLRHKKTIDRNGWIALWFF